MLVDDIIAAKTNNTRSQPGDIVTIPVDYVYLQDGNSPTIAKVFEKEGFEQVFDPSRIGVFFDHSVIWPNKEISNRIREAMDFCNRFGLRMFRSGEGISHVVAIEEGWFAPGAITLGTDSHTCTGGALDCLALGMGASDVVAAMITGETWLRVPETVVINVKGLPHPATCAKDVILYALATFGQEPFLYRSIEWCGPWVRDLSVDARSTIASMAVEMGAKCCFLEGAPHSKEIARLEVLGIPPVDELELNIDGLMPYIARPHLPQNSGPVTELSETEVNYVFVGSCTNSRFEDISKVARVLDGRQIAPGVHCLITPGSRRVFEAASEAGHIRTLMNAGAIVTPPGCGACLGTQGSIPADGDKIVSTMNRNFKGRMGNRDSEIYLASPFIAALCALEGRVPSAQQIDEFSTDLVLLETRDSQEEVT